MTIKSKARTRLITRNAELILRNTENWSLQSNRPWVSRWNLKARIQHKRTETQPTSATPASKRLSSTLANLSPSYNVINSNHHQHYFLLNFSSIFIATDAEDKYSKTLTGRSEYQDTVSKIGMSIIKNRQQYAEPLPSSRRRYGDRNL